MSLEVCQSTDHVNAKTEDSRDIFSSMRSCCLNLFIEAWFPGPPRVFMDTPDDVAASCPTLLSEAVRFLLLLARSERRCWGGWVVARRAPAPPAPPPAPPPLPPPATCPPALPNLCGHLFFTFFLPFPKQSSAPGLGGAVLSIP